MKENGLTQKKTRSKRYPEETITDSDYQDDLALLTNTVTQAESLLHSLDQTVRDKQISCVLIAPFHH